MSIDGRKGLAKTPVSRGVPKANSAILRTCEYYWKLRMETYCRYIVGVPV